MDGLTSSIKKFDGTGYEVWATLIEAVLTARKVNHVIASEMPGDEKAREVFLESDQQTRATLLLSLDPKVVALVLSCTTAKEIWDRIEEVHAQKSVSCKMMLYQEFYSLKMQQGTSVSTYVADSELIARKLRDIGVTIDDDTLIGKIVSGLTPDFRHFISAWMGMPEHQRTYGSLLPRLMAEEMKLT